MDDDSIPTPVPKDREECKTETESSSDSDDDTGNNISDDAEFPKGFFQDELNDFIRDLDLSKNSAELLGTCLEAREQVFTCYFSALDSLVFAQAFEV